MDSFGGHEVGTKTAHQLVSRFVVNKAKRIAGSSALPMKLESRILSLNQKDVDHTSCVREHLCQDISTERSMRHAAVNISSKFARRGRDNLKSVMGKACSFLAVEWRFSSCVRAHRYFTKAISKTCQQAVDHETRQGTGHVALFRHGLTVQ